MSNDYHSSTARGASPHQNRWVAQTLRSPQHGKISQRLMLITFTGRKSRQSYTTPVSYQQEGNTVTCCTDSAWWHNLADSARVTLWLRGQEVAGWAVATTDPQAVAAGLRRRAHHDAEDAQYFGVTIDANGQPDETQLLRAARHNALIAITLG